MGVRCVPAVVTKRTKMVLFVTIIMTEKSYFRLFAPSLPPAGRGTIECASEVKNIRRGVLGSSRIINDR